MDDITMLYGVLGCGIVGLAALFVFMRRRWARWEAVLDHVARTLGGRYRKGYNNGLAAFPGSVEAEIDGRGLTLETATTTEGPSGDSREIKWMFVSIGTTSSKPDFLGPPASRRYVEEVTDYSKKSGGGTIEVAGYEVSTSQLPKRFRRALEEDPGLQPRLAEFFAAGGTLEHGNVVLRTRQFEWDPQRLVERIRSMSALASLIA